MPGSNIQHIYNRFSSENGGQRNDDHNKQLNHLLVFPIHVRQIARSKTITESNTTTTTTTPIAGPPQTSKENNFSTDMKTKTEDYSEITNTESSQLMITSKYFERH